VLRFCRRILGRAAGSWQLAAGWFQSLIDILIWSAKKSGSSIAVAGGWQLAAGRLQSLIDILIWKCKEIVWFN
jgi:hypothetical protein